MSKKNELNEQQLIMDGVEHPASEKPRRRRRVKEARIVSSKQARLMPIFHKDPDKQIKIKRKRNIKLEDAPVIKVNVKVGLTIKQVEERTRLGFSNIIENKNIKTYKSIFFNNIFTFFNLLCFLVAGALAYVGAWTDLFFMAPIIANMLIGITQEIKAKRTIEKISLVSSPTAVVLREGSNHTIAVSNIVLDDIILFSLGKQICADSILIDGEVEVNESLLTGESNAVKKKKGDTLFSGSYVVSGKCTARVSKVGNFSYSAELATKAKQFSKPKSELLSSLRLVMKVISVVIVPLAILTYSVNIANLPMKEAVQSTAPSIIGMIPAGMFLLTSVAIAVGVIKLANKRTLVQDLYSIEMLARVDVLCLDKTGTITDGTMKVNSVIELSKTLENSVDDIIGSMLTALDENNQTTRAMATYFGYSKELVSDSILPFSSDRKLSAVTFKNGKTYALGAPEFVYKLKDAKLDKLVKEHASKGHRVLLVVEVDGGFKHDKLSAKRSPVALIVIEDHIREDAYETIKWFRENDVAVKIISGDNPITVSEVSRRVGVPGAENFISLDGLSEQQVIQSASKYSVFGRVSPEQKLILIKAFKAMGHKVAMTGDGVNDILALKEADCSIAMASGSEAARHVSSLVMLDSNFASMPSIVSEGRRVINNVQKSSSLFLMKTIFTMLVSIFCLILSKEYMFENTRQIMLLEYMVIGLPAFFLSLQPNNERIKGKFLSNILSKAIPAGLVLFFNVLAVYLFDVIWGAGTQFATMISLSVTFSGLLVLYIVCKPIDVFRGILWAGCVILTVAVFIIMPPSFFPYEKLSLQNVLLIVVLVQMSYPIYNGLVKLVDVIRFGGDKTKNKLKIGVTRK